MQAVEGYALVGLLAHAALALLFAAVWHAERARWAACFGGLFAILTLIFLFDAQWRPIGLRPHPAPLSLGMVGAALTAMGLIDLLAPPRRLRRVLDTLSMAWPAALWAAVQAGSGTGLLVLGLALFFSSLAVLVLWAAWRQRDARLLLIFVVFAMYPTVFGVSAAGLIPTGLLRYAAAVPTLALGMTVLTLGLLRAHRRGRDELQRREVAEQALQALNESLEQRVAQRTAELREMVAGLESFNRSVSHDLRGPLGGIAGVSRLARDALARRDLVSAERMLDVITTQADSSAKLVAALLALARVGDVTLAPRTVDLNSFVRDTLEQMRQADTGPMDWPVTVEALPAVRADPDLLRQVLINLVGNALKFSRETDHPQVVVGALGPDQAPAQAHRGEQVVYVRDNGVGFDMKDAPRLFAPFERLQGSQRFQGHGVGLSIVKRIVERHGGTVWAESTPNGGATFYFSLPA